MFNLMADNDYLPVEEENIVQIHQGMNKLRVSVGEHVSEPSEVFIVTGEDGGLYRSFIVFFMHEPESHVIYGFEGNPYAPDRQEDVLGDAYEFLEEMGAILEEVPWESMSAEEQESWLAAGTLYPLPPDDVDDLLEELEEIRPGELLEVLDEEEQAADGQGDDVEGLPGDFGEVPEAEEEEEAPDPMEGGGIDEDGDFDQLLKQAFLKPDMVKKSSVGKGTNGKEEPPEEDVSEDEDSIRGFSFEPAEEGPSETEIAVPVGAVEPVKEPEDELVLDAVEEEPLTAAGVFQERAADAKEIACSVPVESFDQMIIRYLSRF